MVFTDTGKEMVAYLMAFGSGTSYPRYCAIGSGSGAVFQLILLLLVSQEQELIIPHLIQGQQNSFYGFMILAQHQLVA